MVLLYKDPSVKLLPCTIISEYFVVKLFFDSLAYVKLYVWKHALTIDGSAVQNRLYENYLMRKFITRNIHNLLYVILISIERVKKNNFDFENRAIFLVKVVNCSIYKHYEKMWKAIFFC